MKMSFVTLKMSGNPTSPMFLFLPFPEGGEGAGASGSLVLGVDVSLPVYKNCLLSRRVSVAGSMYVSDQIIAVRALNCLYSVSI